MQNSGKLQQNKAAANIMTVFLALVDPARGSLWRIKTKLAVQHIDK